jgi:hypothetical protein
MSTDVAFVMDNPGGGVMRSAFPGRFSMEFTSGNLGNFFRGVSY